MIPVKQNNDSLLQENEQLKASLRKVYSEQQDFVNSVTEHSKESK